MPPRLFLCSALECLQEGMDGSLLQYTGFIALRAASRQLLVAGCYYVLLNLLVRESPGSVGNQAAQVSSDQESGNGGIMLVLLPIFICQ